jgi:hypothetical protein
MMGVFDMWDVPAPLFNLISTALVALLAGTLSYSAGKGMTSHEWKLNLRREKVAIRQRLYADFLAEADRQMLQSIDEKSSTATAFYEITRNFSEITLLASAPVAKAARAICDHIIHAHATESSPGTDFDQLKQGFIRDARSEIAAYEEGRL